MFNRSKAINYTRFDKILRVLNRDDNIPSLDSLIHTLSKKTDNESIDTIAIGFDTNILLKLTSHKQSADIIDYLSTSHKAPIFLPGQIIQEFWNNQLNAIDTISSSLKRSFDQLKSNTQKIDNDFGSYADEFEALIDKFSSEYGSIYDKKTLVNLSLILKALKDKAQVPYAPRELFYSCATIRKKTKTPPGFKDDINNYGDAYVWFDFLTGLLDAREAKKPFSKAVFVTNEKKIDWCNRAGIAHPILVAEIKEIFNVEFEIWDIEELAKNISKQCA